MVISKSKCTKHTILGPLLEVEMSKKCTPLWREAHFEVKMYKTRHVRATFGGSDVEKVHAVVARSTFRSQNVKNTRVSVLRATTACNFSSLIWPAGSAPAALASLLFDPPEPQIIGKTQCFATFLPFRASAFSFF